MINVSTFFGWLNYLKYNEMAGLTSAIFFNSDMANETEVNVYIDLGSMCERLYNPTVERSMDPTELSSVIINLAGHIRSYFRSMHNVSTTIFFVYSDNDWSVLRKIYPKWNEFYKGKKKKYPYWFKYIRDSIKVVSLIVPYLYKVYLIKSDAECGTMILSTINKERSNGNNHPNIIFTKELNLIQIPIYDNRSFIYYKNCLKSHNQIFGITRENAFESYIKLTKRWSPVYANPDAIVFLYMMTNGDTRFVTKSKRLENIGKMVQNFNPDYFDLFIALSNLSSRDLKQLLSWTDALKAIDNFKDDIFIINDLEKIYNKLDLSCKIYSKCSLEEFITRYTCVSIKRQVSMYESMPDYNIDYRIDMSNADELKYLNDHYFIKNYIELNKF